MWLLYSQRICFVICLKLEYSSGKCFGGGVIQWARFEQNQSAGASNLAIASRTSEYVERMQVTFLQEIGRVDNAKIRIVGDPLGMLKNYPSVLKYLLFTFRVVFVWILFFSFFLRGRMLKVPHPGLPNPLKSKSLIFFPYVEIDI